MRNPVLDIHAVERLTRTIWIAGEIQQRAPVEQDRVGDPAILRRDAFRSSAGRTNAPDVEFVGQLAEDEVEEGRIGRP